MTLDELVAAADEEDFAGFASSEAFDAVLADAKALMDGAEGDIDGDSAVDSSDITMLRKMVLGVIDDIAAADLNGDEAVDVRDIVYLKRILVK